MKFSPAPCAGQILSKKIDHDFENTLIRMFLAFFPNETGHSSNTPSVTAPCTAVQSRCISLQNLSQNEIADSLRSPTARLGCRFVCTTSGFAQKRDTKPVGGRGISAFSAVFFLACHFSSASHRFDPLCVSSPCCCLMIGIRILFMHTVFE